MPPIGKEQQQKIMNWDGINSLHKQTKNNAISIEVFEVCSNSITIVWYVQYDNADRTMNLDIDIHVVPSMKQYYVVMFTSNTAQRNRIIV